MGFATKKITKDTSDWIMSKTLLPVRVSTVFWNGISSGAGKFVSVAYNTQNGLYATDLQNINITELPGGAYANWRSVAYGKGIFAAVTGPLNEYIYSTNGQTWATADSGSSKNSITYGKGLFVSVGNNSSASYSSDGINWTEISIPVPSGPTTQINYSSVSYGNGIFVAIANNSYNNNCISAVSTNGTTWSSYLFSTGESFTGGSIAFGNGYFVIVPSNTSRKIFYSSNGINWGQSWTQLPITGSWRISYGSGKFCITNRSGFPANYPNNAFYYGSDPSIFFRSILPRSQPSYDVSYGYGKFIVVGLDRVSYTSSNKLPESFTSNTLSSSGNWTCQAYGRGAHVIISSSLGRTMYSSSTNTTSFSLGTIQTKAWNDVTYGGGRFVAVSSDSNGISYSDDGVTWTNVTNAAVSRLSIAYGDGRFVCVGNSTTSSYSSNGSSWTNVTLASSGWKSVKYGLGKFVAIKNGTSFIYSSNGTTWNNATAPSGNWSKLQYGSGVFVAFSETQSSQFIYSTDGINWTAGSIPINATIISLKYGGGIFIAIPSNNVALFSYNGINWTAGVTYNYASGDSDIRTTGYGHGYFIAPVYGTNRFISVYPQIFREVNTGI